jgi:aminoglycoside phosphotransferase (APT) family kinase protein
MPFSHDLLTAAVQPHLSGADSFAFEPIRTGKFNTSFFISASNGEYVLRIAPPRDAVFLFYERDMMRQEPDIHRLLREQTSVPVAEIVAYDDSLGILPRDFLLMERLPGKPWTDAPRVNGNRVLHQVGKYLAQTHRLTADTYGYIGAHRPMEAQSNWQDAFTIMWHRLIDDIVGVDGYSKEEADAMRALYDSRRDLFSHPVESRLLHMDIWHQNIMVNDNSTVTGLIDWDRALWGDPEIEFAVLDYCGISEPAFWDGYGQPRDESRAARIRQVFYLLYEVQKYIVIRIGRSNDRPGAQRFRQYALQLAQNLRERTTN